MGRNFAICGFVAALLLAASPASAQVATAPPARLPPEQPRYAAQIPPSTEDAALDPSSASRDPAATAAAPPAAAPTTPVAVQSPPRYAVAEPPIETVTVNGLRQSEDGGYRLGTGDKLRLTVFNETDLSGDFVVDSLGYVRLPLIGQVAAAGLTTYGLENRIALALNSGGYLVDPKVSVEVTTYRPFYIIGEVAKPGEYPYINAMSAPNAIALAGGYTDRAVESEIYIRHEGETREQELPADESTRIRPGDVIRVKRTTYWEVMTFLAPLFSPFTTAAYLLK